MKNIKTFENFKMNIEHEISEEVKDIIIGILDEMGSDINPDIVIEKIIKEISENMLMYITSDYDVDDEYSAIKDMVRDIVEGNDM